MITLAKDGMRSDLERLWRSSFNDSDRYVRYFFEHRYNPNACAVYVDENAGRPVAMLHMLNAYITEDSELSRAQYIYAACTRPDYRGRGIMRALIEYSKRYAAACGQKYIMLVPGTRELFKYYEASGFYRCFSVREVFMNRKDLITLSGGKESPEENSAYKLRETTLSMTDLHSVRRDILVDREGFVTWDFPAFKYAAGAHENDGGQIITAADGSETGYAMCELMPDGTVFVREFLANNGFDSRLIRNLLKVYDQQEFKFRVPVFNELFAPFGEVVDYGMLCSVKGKPPISFTTLKGAHLPYLGLALD